MITLLDDNNRKGKYAIFANLLKNKTGITFRCFTLNTPETEPNFNDYHYD